MFTVERVPEQFCISIDDRHDDALIGRLAAELDLPPEEIIREALDRGLAQLERAYPSAGTVFFPVRR